MRVLVTGVNGQLGYDVVKELKIRELDCLGVDIQEFDITDFEQTERFITQYTPTIIIHCAAYTAVDKAEDEQELCHNINMEGTRNIALVCNKMDIALLYTSTDYVFDGMGDTPHEVDDITSPISIYGKTKLGGEIVVKELLEKYFIVRISWVFGKNGNNFIKTMLRLGKERETIDVVCDQIGSPTYTADLSKLLCDMIMTDRYGIYHASNEGYCSWAEFAEEIFRQTDFSAKVNFISTEQYPTKAVRPKNSRLSKVSLDKVKFKRLPEWKDALNRFLKEIKL